MASKTTTYFPPVGPPRQVRIAPNHKVADLPHEDVPTIAFGDWLPQGDGTYRPVMRIHAQQVRLSPDTHRTLGLGIAYNTLKRLIRAGFISGARITPSCYVFNLQSYYDHIERCKDIEFWTPERIKTYMNHI